MSNTGVESNAGNEGSMTSINQTTRIHALNAAGAQLTEAGQHLMIGLFTEVAFSLKAAGEYLTAAGMSAGNSLIAAGDVFAEEAGSQVGSSQFQNPGPVSQSSAGSSPPGPGIGGGAVDQINLQADGEEDKPATQNELIFPLDLDGVSASEAALSGGALPSSDASQSPSGSGSDGSDPDAADGELQVGGYMPPSYLKEVMTRKRAQ